MSVAIPISFLLTLVCVLMAIDWPMVQQIMFVGAAVSATVFFCYLEGLGINEKTMRREDGSEL